MNIWTLWPPASCLYYCTQIGLQASERQLKRAGQVQPTESMWKPNLCPVRVISRMTLAAKILKDCHRRKMSFFSFHFCLGFCQGFSDNAPYLGKTTVGILLAFALSTNLTFFLHFWNLLLYFDSILTPLDHFIWVAGKKKTLGKLTKMVRYIVKIFPFKNRVKPIFQIGKWTLGCKGGSCMSRTMKVNNESNWRCNETSRQQALNKSKG